MRELTEARIAVRLAELRVLAAETAYEYSRERCSATTRRLLEPLQARSPERACAAQAQGELRRPAAVLDGTGIRAGKYA